MPVFTALDLYQRACDQESAHGCSALANHLYAGDGVEKDVRRARALLERACTQLKHAESCFQLGTLRASGEGGPADDKQAAELYRQACDGGSGAGCGNLGAAYLNGLGVPADAAGRRGG